MIYLELDLSQIESRIVFMLTGDPDLVRIAQLPSYEYDVHTENIAIVGLVRNMAEVEEIKAHDPKRFKDMRHVGKITSHGAQRDMHGATLSGNILKELEVLISPEKCEQYIQNYHTRYPAIRRDYFRGIRRKCIRDRRLTNSWGRYIDFTYDRLDDELYRQAYSFLPQSENADILSQHGILPLWLYMKGLYGRPPNVQVHDSILLSVQPEDAYDIARFARANLEKPITIGGSRLVPFVEYKLGINWAANEQLGEGREWKKLPSREEFTEAAFKLENLRRERL